MREPLDTIKVMTFNIHHGKGTDKKLELNRIKDVIYSSGADIIGLNEVDKNFSKRSNYVDQIELLANELHYFYAFSPSLSKKSRKTEYEYHQYGNALLSRYPLKHSQNHLLNYLPRVIEGRSVLEAAIEVNEKILNVFVTHLSLNPITHWLQSSFILNKLEAPAIILGDWNMKPYSRNWKRVTKNFEDVWEEKGSGLGNTYPSTKPRMRLDYIFISHDLKTVDVKVIDQIPFASDHLPLVATLSI
ncbi:endonuclease/exonuclease/phosphatase family protein [Fredinandcohnia sp. 179-A 10B2 NHS]|uniref:endonuclease/exonuclease/phosphatase family protein n=1 Tax=Fredinandcohnia sp. 179-A 10B2 NHS TaxID=3235176 RepID=UPI00399F42D4